MKRHLLPIFGIVALWAFIVVRNYTPGTWLTGWDNLHPEFDFILNIKRSLFGVWQEYQGLGLLGGMGHIAGLPRELILWVLSLVLPASHLRYAWTFLMLLLGPLGAYVLTWHLISKSQSNTKQQTAYLIGAWTAGIFYLFNLNTVQTFVAPYEAFITNYGALPWILWAVVRFFDTPNRRTLALYGLISVLGMTHAYIPTLFLVYVITLAPIIIAAVLRAPGMKSLQAIGALIGTTICINAMWALPFAYFTLTNSSVVVNSKINQMATQEIYLKNQKYGTLIDTLRLKNFWFDTVDLDPTNQGYIRMLEGWPEFTSSSLYQWTSATLVILVLGGWVIMLKRTRLRAWSIVGLIAFTMMAADTVPFSTIVLYLRDHVPLLSQFFRFPFTKWGTTLSLIYALSLAVAVSALMGWLEKKRTYTMLIPLLLAVTILPILSHLPIFYQPLISPLMKRDIPQEYVALYNAMKAKPSGRIAYLPMQSFWDWKYFRWGYFGSGFLWYGLKQPVLDQAFNSWSAYNENYYWELSRAIYGKDPNAVGQVFAKYDIGAIILDENIVNADNNRSLYTEEIKAVLEHIPSVRPVAALGKLTLYEQAVNDTKSFVSLKANLPAVSPAYRFTDNDVAFGELGDYIDGKREALSKKENTTIIYPFRSLFTKRSVDEREFTVTETPDAITIGSIVEATSASILKADTLVYDSAKSVDLAAENVKPCGVLREGEAGAQNLDQAMRFTSRNQRGCLSFGTGNLPHREGYLVAVESRHLAGRPMLFSLINQTAKHVELETYLQPRRVRPFEAADYFILPPLANDGIGYTVYLSNDAIGRQETVNDIKSIKFYRIPYQELVALHSTGVQPLSPDTQPQGTFAELSVNPALSVERVYHPNPAYYKIEISEKREARSENDQNTTLVLSQSFDPGWVAFTKTPTFPFITPIKDHVLVNNWENGWKLSAISHQLSDKNNNASSCLTTDDCRLTTIVLFFLPQLLQWLGFVLLPLPFLYAFRPRN